MAHWISSANILYMGGTICTGMFINLSENTNATWLVDWRAAGAIRFCRAEWNSGLDEELLRRYSIRALMDGRFCFS